VNQRKKRPTPSTAPDRSISEVAAAVRALPSDQRTVLIELAVRHASVTETAERLCLSAEHVKLLANSALVTLGRSLR
jgi:DNA-directed RNA polymerase specialized sigma24 family protein